MRSKKKGQNKARANRSNKAVAVSKDVKNNGLHTNENETFDNENELKLHKKELSNNLVDSPSTGVEMPIKEVDLANKEVLTSSTEVDLANKEVNASTTEVDLAIKEGIIHSTEVDLLSKEVEMPSEELQASSESENCCSTTMALATQTAPTPKELDAPPEVPEIIKHPLENTWGFWLFTNENKKNWTENQKELTQFDTVEDYWCLYHHMKLPSELKMGQDYAVFKQGISPMWEDSANNVGGRWFINLERKDRSEMDRIWLDVVLLMIGENFKHSDLICGAVVNVRSKNRVSVWTRNKEELPNIEIGKKLKETLRLNFRLHFHDHKSNSILYVL